MKFKYNVGDVLAVTSRTTYNNERILNVGDLVTVIYNDKYNQSVYKELYKIRAVINGEVLELYISESSVELIGLSKKDFEI